MTDTKVQDGFFPFDEIPDSGVLPDGVFQARGESLEMVTTSTGKKMYSMRAAVELPEDYAGMNFFENFVIGTDDDPMAEYMSTWKKSIGARRLKGLMKAANIPGSSSEAQITAGFPGVMFLVQASQYTEAKGDYAGTVRNRFNFYPIGAKATGVSGGGGARGTVAAAPAPPPTAPPVAEPVAAPAPAPPPVAEPAAAAPAGEAQIPCGNCGKSFPVSEFGTHVQACLQA